MTESNWLIATDLDGTLLDDSYAYEDAGQAIDQIQQSYASQVALASSKTLAEMLELTQHTSTPPFLIFENGGGVAWPSEVLGSPGESNISGYEVTLLGGNVEEIRRVLRRVRNDNTFKFDCFSELSDERIEEITQLSPAAIALARRRQTSEPVLWRDSEDQSRAFSNVLNELGFTLTQGGRFLHVSQGTNKARALKYIRRKICYERGEKLRVLACGDAPNDLEMINAADLALLFPSSDGRYLRTTDDKHTHALRAGPTHWLKGVLQVFASA